MRRDLHAKLVHYVATAPRPTGSRVTTLPGRDPVRVLLLGSGLAVGYGVTSRKDALDGHLADRLGTATGRGVTVTNYADATRPLMEQVFEAQLTRSISTFELVVWSPSSLDMCGRRFPASWERRLAGVRQLLEPTTPLLVTGLAVASDAPEEGTAAVRLAEALNASLYQAVRRLAGVTVVDAPTVPLYAIGHPAFSANYFAELAGNVCAAYLKENRLTTASR